MAIPWRLFAGASTRRSTGFFPRPSDCWRRDLPRALLSGSDKGGLTGFARGLQRRGFELYATGNPLTAILEAAIDAHPITDLTGIPEMTDGRVETLDPGVHACLRRAGDSGLPRDMSFAGQLVQVLKYGENEHQRAAFYRFGPEPGGLGGAKQLQGKEAGFNNIQDAAAAFELVNDYDQPAAAIIKHMNPCGLAVAEDIATAYRMAYECDKVSAFGGVVAVNRPLGRSTAELLVPIVPHGVVAP